MYITSVVVNVFMFPGIYCTKTHNIPVGILPLLAYMITVLSCLVVDSQSRKFEH